MNKYICMLVYLVFAGCTTHKISFDCKVGKGLGCTPLSKVNQYIDNNYQVDAGSRQKSKFICDTCNKEEDNERLQPEIKGNNLLELENNSIRSLSDTNSLAALRTKEKIMRIWFNGYFDKYNNYHDEQYIYTVIEEAKWKNVK